VPEYRRKGIFSLMFEYVKQAGVAEGIAGLRLYVEAENTRAQSTYEAMGMDGAHYRTYEWMAD
jgi:ribosomal protein S18 acetylase RimI-like enzyme